MIIIITVKVIIINNNNNNSNNYSNNTKCIRILIITMMIIIPDLLSLSKVFWFRVPNCCLDGTSMYFLTGLAVLYCFSMYTGVVFSIVVCCTVVLICGLRERVLKNVLVSWVVFKVYSVRSVGTKGTAGLY